MSDITLFPLAFAAGLISFASPCVLPLLPGYLSFISGTSVQDLKSGHSEKGRMLFTTLLFVIGFTIIFTLLGSAFSFAGQFLNEYRLGLERVAGVVIILAGLFLTGLIKIPALYREVRFIPQTRRFGALSALPLGMAFAVGWTPCIGPMLGAILSIASVSPGKGATLLLVYSLGLGIPFIVAGLLFGRLSRTLDWFKRNAAVIHGVSGAFLMIFGILLLSGRWTQIIAPIQTLVVLPI